MFRLYSKGCEYAIRALVIASDGGKDKDARFQAKDVCKRAGIPESFTRKVLQELVQAGILTSGRGPSGGYRLAGDPDEISILRIVRAIDGDAAFGNCVMGLAECKPENPCPMHDYWTEMKDPMLAQLEERTLGDLMGMGQRMESEKP